MDGTRTTVAATLALAWLGATGCDGAQLVGQPKAVASAPGTPGEVVADRDYVYWTSAGSPRDGGTVLRADGRGAVSEPKQLATGEADPFAIALVNNEVYWVNRGTGLGDGALRKVSAEGGAPVSLAERQTAAYDLQFGVLGAKSVLAWTAPDETDATKRVKTFEIGGTAVNDAFAGAQGRPIGIAVGAAALYWADSEAGKIVRYDLAMGVTAELAAGQDSPYGIALDDGFVYWTTLGRPEAGVRGEVKRVEAGAPGGTPLLIADEQNIGARGRIAVSNRWVYWFNVEGSSHTLMTAPVDGGPSRKVAIASGADVVDLAIFDGWIYWTVAGQFEGSVYAIEEPTR